MGFGWYTGFLWEYRQIFLYGIAVTIGLTLVTNILGIFIGLGVGTGRLFAGRFLNIPLIGYIEIFRCTPLLVQLIWAYYALPIILGIDISSVAASILTLSLYAGAFYAEIFRGGVASVDNGQWDAARAIGMRWPQCFRRIILPQAIRLMAAPIVSQSVLQLKNTSLVSTIAVGDLLYQGQIVTAATYRPLEVYTAIAVLYFIILFPATYAARVLERSLLKGDPE